MKSSPIAPTVLAMSLLALSLPAAAGPAPRLPVTPVIGGPGTTTPPQAYESPSLKKLDSDSRSLYKDQEQLVSRVNTAKTALSDTDKGLGALETLQSDLAKLESALRAADKAAETAEVIPQAHDKAKKIRDTISPALAKVSSARKRLDAIVARTKPLRPKLQKASKAAGDLAAGLGLLNSEVVANIPGATAAAEACLLKAPDAKKPCITSSLDSKANGIDGLVTEYDRVVKALIATPEPWLPSTAFLDPVQAQLKAISALCSNIEALTGRLDTLTSQLKELNKVLDKDFSFSFPYPNPSWKKPWRISHKKVSIGFRTIIKGANAIENAIEKYLSKALWKVLKGLGVGKFVHELQDKANDAVNSAMKAVKFDVDVNLPSLQPLYDFEASLNGLARGVDGLKFPAVGNKMPNFGLPGVKAGLDLRGIQGSLSFFAPNGFNLRAPNLCTGATYGCN